MKKIIAATAGLMLVGSMCASAFATVTFTGNARERMTMKRDYNFDDKTDDSNQGRVRIVIKAESKGGAFASVRMRFADGTYDGTEQTGKAGIASGTDYYTDWAYMGLPIGPVTIEAGLMPDFTDYWFFYDKRADRVSATYKSKMTEVNVHYDKLKEYTDPSTVTLTTIYPVGVVGPLTGSAVAHAGTDFTDDNDIDAYGLIIKQKFGSDWAAMLYYIYIDDQTAVDASGSLGTVQVTGNAGPVALKVEGSYKQKDVTAIDNQAIAGNDSDGYGGIVHATMNFGPATGTLVVGFTKDGFKPDANYGFIMLGQAMGGAEGGILPVVGSPISVVGVGSINDNTFVGGIFDYKVNDMIKLVGILAYDDIKDYGKLTEVSGLIRFDVVEGGYIDLGAGALVPKLDNSATPDNTAYGAFTELGMSF